MLADPSGDRRRKRRAHPCLPKPVPEGPAGADLSLLLRPALQLPATEDTPPRHRHH